MIDKFVHSVSEALAGVADGSVVLVGGFGEVGLPEALVEGLIDLGVGDLTLVHNNAGVGQHGLAYLLNVGRVRKVICSFPKSSGSVIFQELYKEGKIELELVPQGTLAERIRAAGAGVKGFYTPVAARTQLAEGKETREIDGEVCVFEHALYGDVALIEAWKADRWGNLTYRGTGRNFNPVMATAAKLTVVQTHHLMELGTLDPEAIVTPGIFVNRILKTRSSAATS